jgi:flagellar basal body-associated protein FliL
MAFAGGEDAAATNKMHETLKLLYETIQKQTKATNRQSSIMIWLTIALVIFTVALLFVAVYQLKVMETNPKNDQAKNYEYQGQENKSAIPTLPRITKGVNEKHNK